MLRAEDIHIRAVVKRCAKRGVQVSEELASVFVSFQIVNQIRLFVQLKFNFEEKTHLYDSVIHVEYLAILYISIVINDSSSNSDSYSRYLGTIPYCYAVVSFTSTITAVAVYDLYILYITSLFV